METVDLSTRGVMAILQVSQAVSTFYGEPLEAVVTDAARAVGADSVTGIHPTEHKTVLTYLAGRLSLPG